MKTKSLLSCCFVAIALTLFFTACDKQPPAPSRDSTEAVPPTSQVLKIAITRDGSITADGSPTTLEELSVKLKDLAARKGAVWYYREAGQEEPHPNALKVLRAVMENRLPIRLSSKPDYSDSI